MQTEEMADYGQDFELPGCPKGDGGNKTLINQTEDDIGPKSWENIPCEYTRQFSLTEDFSSVQGVYLEAPSATSDGHL
jgi:hypothetical protein